MSDATVPVVDDELIARMAQTPLKVVGDEGSVEERSIDDLMKAAKFIASNGANRPPYGMCIARIRQGGTV